MSPYAGTESDSPFRPSVDSPSVREILRAAVPVIRFECNFKLDCLDREATFENCSRDSMHAIHHATVDAEDDWMGTVDFLD